ncbi:4a-hydroxytetrahydrobiopterin dehydratase [Streptacidiphilus rugosus]|uniref:4a-hydroxytetrahydrobiopterin dehydratase n=1 Tax=Streptacidiphilus rugosus TaxID=405783 RepID=UPI00056B7A63|nr:4a-hydroxytetrahydrobiopterin dehydratase [Streptacidiphilus rugosus]
MSNRDLLSDEQLTAGLRTLPEWRREGDSIARTVQAKDFPAAIRVVVAVAEQAEALDHHPDIDIRWRTLHFTLSTHSSGGITALDLKLASLIDASAAAEA